MDLRCDYPKLPSSISTPSSAPFHDEMVDLLESTFSGFTSARSDDALVGPMNVLLHFPSSASLPGTA